MSKPSREFVFKVVYETAALVEACIDYDSSIIELDWDDRDLLLGLVKFSKISILQRYIYVMIAVERHREYRKNADLYESGEIADLERIFDAYAICYEPYTTFSSPISPETSTSRVEDPFYQWFLSQKKSFELLLSFFGRNSRMKRFTFSLGTVHSCSSLMLPSLTISKM